MSPRIINAKYLFQNDVGNVELVVTETSYSITSYLHDTGILNKLTEAEKESLSDLVIEAQAFFQGLRGKTTHV